MRVIVSSDEERDGETLTREIRRPRPLHEPIADARPVVIRKTEGVMDRGDRQAEVVLDVLGYT